MPRKEPVPDASITQKATQQIANRGIRTPCRISVQTRKGEVTLSGNVQYPHQRDAAIAAIRSIDGIRKVHDQIKVRPPVKHEYKTLPRAVKETAPVEAEAAETEAAEAAETSAAAAGGAEAPAPLVAETASSTTEFELGPAPVRRGPAVPAATTTPPPASTH
jgi:hyperosmotically inducible protein